MGIGGISIWQLLIVLAIVIMIFGTKKLKTLGSDLGSAVKGFRQSVTDKTEDKGAEETVQKSEAVEEEAAASTADTATAEKTEAKEKV